MQPWRGFVAFMARASAHADEGASPIYGVTIRAGYRDWKLIAVEQLLVPGKADQLRARVTKCTLLSTSISGLCQCHCDHG